MLNFELFRTAASSSIRDDFFENSDFQNTGSAIDRLVPSRISDKFLQVFQNQTQKICRAPKLMNFMKKLFLHRSVLIVMPCPVLTLGTLHRFALEENFRLHENALKYVRIHLG